MTPFLFLLSLFLGVISPPGPAHAAPEPPRPAAATLRFVQTACDLGPLIQGQQADCLFRFTNEGGEDLRIVKVEPTCGCTTALLTAPVVPPGGAGSIRVSFDSSNFAGEVSKEVLVHSSDPAQPAMLLTLRALVEPEVDLEPRQVVFDGIRPGSPRRESATLVNRSAAPVEIQALTVAPASFGCLIPAWTDPSRPLVLQSWDRVDIDIGFSPPPTIAMPIAGECVVTIQGPLKNRFTLKLLALP